MPGVDLVRLLRVEGATLTPDELVGIARVIPGVAVVWQVDDPAAALSRIQAAGVDAEPWSDAIQPVAGRLYVAAESAAAAEAAEATEGSDVSSAVAQRDRYLATLSHELRNPLMAISSAADLLRKDARVSAGAHRSADVILRQIRHMARLLDDLLDVSRIRLDSIEMQVERLDLRRVVHDSADEIHAIAQVSDVQLFIVTDRTPVYVRADPARMRQVLVNLVSNAVKYSPVRGRIDVEITLERGSEAVMRVRDEGRGMDEATRARVFEPFFQGQAPTEGLGLGLALVAAIATSHQGSVHAFSDGPGRGSVFEVRLPRAGPRAAPLAVETPTDAVSSPVRVLVVEDQDDNRELLELLLENRGFRVESEPDATSAIDRLQAEAFDVAIVDLGLPDAPGFDVARAARRLESGERPMRLIALTGHGQPTDRAAAMDAGFDHHVVKPVDIGVLVELFGTGTKRSR